MISEHTHKVPGAQRAQKSCFYLPVSFHQRFIMLLTEHLVRCETSSIDINTPWYKNCIERLQQIFLMVTLMRMYVHVRHNPTRALG